LKGKNQSKKSFTNSSEICKGCYRWDTWQHKCSYFWNEKKECGSKVKDYDDMVELDQIRRR